MTKVGQTDSTSGGQSVSFNSLPPLTRPWDKTKNSNNGRTGGDGTMDASLLLDRSLYPTPVPETLRTLARDSDF